MGTNTSSQFAESLDVSPPLQRRTQPLIAAAVAITGPVAVQPVNAPAPPGGTTRMLGFDPDPVPRPHIRSRIVWPAAPLGSRATKNRAVPSGVLANVVMYPRPATDTRALSSR